MSKCLHNPLNIQVTLQHEKQVVKVAKKCRIICINKVKLL